MLTLERERWWFDRVSGADVVLGHYRRDVSVVALDGRPFLCNQELGYVQSSEYDVRATSDRHGVLTIAELAYRTAPSPCEPGFRKLGDYTGAFLRDGALALSWDGGDETLERGTELPDRLPAPPALPAPRVAGAWHWNLRSHDAAGYAREEDEAWQLAVGEDGTVGGTYVRTVTTYTEDGSVIPCAGAAQWRFVDRYQLRGRLDGDDLTLEERSVDPGTHPCLAATPDRHLDAATGTTVGSHLLLTWRGNREQVLHRPP